MEEHRITRIGSSTKSKAGVEYRTKDGKPYTRVFIQTDQLPQGIWASSNAFREDDPILQLKEGDAVTLKVWQQGQWWNFKIPTRLDQLEDRVQVIENWMYTQMDDEEKKEEKGGEIKAEDLPF